jgi:hypothetical protein
MISLLRWAGVLVPVQNSVQHRITTFAGTGSSPPQDRVETLLSWSDVPSEGASSPGLSDGNPSGAKPRRTLCNTTQLVGASRRFLFALAPVS